MGDLTTGFTFTDGQTVTHTRLNAAVNDAIVVAASTTMAGKVELATDAEAQAGVDTARAITPANLASVTGTTTRAGLLELATDAEAQTGTDTARAITPANLASVTGTTTRAGLLELATVAEVTTGTDTARAVTPDGVKTANHTLTGSFLSVGGFLVLGSGGTLTIASGAITVTSSQHALQNEGGAATDDLDTINGATTAGTLLLLRTVSSLQDVVCKDGTGNLLLAGDFTLSNPQDRLLLIYDGTNWAEVSRSDNAA